MATQSSTLAAAKDFDVNEALVAAGGDAETREVKASSLIRYIQSTLMLSFERARDMLNVLVELGRAVWTSFSVVRIAAAAA